MTQLTHATQGEGNPAGFVEELRGYVGILRRGWRLIAVSVLISLTLAAFSVSRIGPVYKGSARLLILQVGGRPFNVARGNDPPRGGEADDDLPTHVMIIRSPLIVDRAIALSGLKGLTLQGVIARLTVSRPDPAAKILEIGYHAETRAAAIRVIESVMRSYQEFLEVNYQKNSKDVISLISKARDELSEELKELERKYLEFHKGHPVLVAGADGRSLLVRRLDQWDSASNEAMVKAVRLKSQLELARTLTSQGLGMEAVAGALRVLGEETASALTLGPDQRGAGDTYEQIDAHLTDVETRRLVAERVLKQLRAEAEATAQEVSEAEIVEAFFAEPDALRLRDLLAQVQKKRDMIQKTVRVVSDPALVMMQNRAQELEEELGRLWRRRYRVIRDRLSRSSRTEADSAIRKAETELGILKAQEGVLRDRVERFRSEEHLDEPQVRLVAVRDPEVPQSSGGAARGLTAGGPSPPTPMHLGQGRQAGVLLRSIEQSLEAIEAMRAEMRRRFDRDLADSRDTEIERLTEDNLKADLERHRAMFNSVMEQLKQAQLVGDFSSTTAQVLNPVATSRSSKRAPILVLGVVIGGGLGIALAILTDLMDPRLRTLSEIRRVLDLSVLGLVPHLPRERAQAQVEVGLISEVMPRSLVAEVFTSIRTNVEFYRRSHQVQVLLVTSPNPDDGKSTTASNLAISLAHAGRKVLLVDADMRRPSQHRIHGLERARGLSCILGDPMPLSRVVQPTTVENLECISTGPEVPNPAELLASPRFGQVVDSARALYDIVILDSPPLLAVADPCIAGASADGIVLVVRATSIRRHEIERAMELLRTLGTSLVGAVINDMSREHAGYQYDYYEYSVAVSSLPLVKAPSGRRADRAPGTP